MSAFDPERLERIGRYPVGRFIASGGMAWVFEVSDPNLFDAQRALKLLRPEAALGNELERFRLEVMVLARIQHPNLIRVYDFGRDEGTGCFYYTMDLMEGGTLSDVHLSAAPADPEATAIQRAGHSVPQVCEYFVGTLSGLARLHADGVFHRDIKPSNIFLSSEGIAVLGDLGIAKRRGEAGHTQAGLTPVTPLYASPEQALGEEFTGQSDLFSVGLTMYRVLTGRSVYQSIQGLDTTNSQAVLGTLWSRWHGRQEFELRFPAGVPEPLQAIVRRACRLRRDERHPSAEEMGAALKRALRELDRAELAPLPKPRHGVRAWAAALLAASLLGAGAWGAYAYWILPARALRAQELASQSGEYAGDLLAWARGTTDRDLEEILGEAEARRSEAARAVEEAKMDLDFGQFPSASRRFQRAAALHKEVCELLAKRRLQPDAARASKAALETAAKVDPSAAEHLPDLWREFESARSELERRTSASAGEGCEGALDLREQIQEAGELSALAAKLDEGLGPKLREIAAAAVAEAAAELGKAEGAATKHEAYSALVARARAALRDARDGLRDGLETEPARLRAARERAREALEASREALAVSLALTACETVREHAQQCEREGISIGVNRNRLREAERELEAKRWNEAREGCERAEVEVAGLLQRAAPALSARAECEPVRKKAASPGQSGELRTAEERWDEASTHLLAGKFPEAERLYREARGLYVAAMETGEDLKGRLELARQEVKSALSKETEVARYATDVADYKESLEGARGLLAEARDALEEGAADRALERARTAHGALDRTLDIRDALDARRRAEGALAAAKKAGLGEGSWAPEEARARTTLELASWKESQELYGKLRESVESLSTRARPAVQARASAERARREAEKAGVAPTSLATAERAFAEAAAALGDGKLDVARQGFEDASRRFAEADRAVPPPNRPPQLARRLPGAETLSLEAHEEQAFEVSATDPDGDPVEVSWTIDDTKAGSGERYELAALSPGSHRVTAVATDSRGAASTLKWALRVEAPPPPPVSAPPPETASTDSGSAVRNLFAEWDRAWNERDCKRLSEIEIMNSQKREKLCAALAQNQQVSQTYAIREVQQSGAGSYAVEICYERDFGPMAPSLRRAATAVVSSRDGRWVISEFTNVRKTDACKPAAHS